MFGNVCVHVHVCVHDRNYFSLRRGRVVRAVSKKGVKSGDQELSNFDKVGK